MVAHLSMHASIKGVSLPNKYGADVHLEGPWQAFLSASAEQHSSRDCQKASATGSFLLIHHLVIVVCCGLNGFSQS